ncbi:MAG: ABC transporter ATP-binding protein [Deltaproteobacteria bacterium]|nr:ABC transporter ATP-binding protein [Deltaproteobacteria bacterium]
MRSAIQIKDLHFSYKDLTVLKNISFSIKKESFYIIIGPNGSGKTTLLKLISGIINPEHDSIHMLGKSVLNYSRKTLARKLAFVQQNQPVDFSFTVFELVLMGRSPHMGMLGVEKEKDIDIATQAISFTAVDHLVDRKLDQLSGGEQQRVFLARAICQEPEIILLDEPTASLDLSHQIRIMDLMRKLMDEKGITVVMVSHDVNLAAMYADELLLLSKGRMMKKGKPDKVLTFQTLEKAYDCKLLVDESPVGNFPRITLVPHRFLKDTNQ